MLTLETSALNALRRLASDSDCLEPIAVLGKRSNIFESDALSDAYISNDAQNLSDIAKQEWSQMSGNLKLVTDVLMIEKSEAQSDDLILIDGITFELPALLSSFLQEACLFYENGFFVLRNRNGEIIELPF